MTCIVGKFELILLMMSLLSEDVDSNTIVRENTTSHPKGCSFIKCKDGQQCVNRRFWCKYPPCPDMMYCIKSKRESLNGPQSCDSVRCSKGHICVVKVRHCSWNEGCKEQLARCVSEVEYHDGPASCAGFKCPSGQECILREAFCTRTPCKLLKSCDSKKDVHMYLDKCKALNCLSAHECFLRRPEEPCANPPCKHQPACTARTEAELARNEKCRGWICPEGHECTAEGQCTGKDCRIFRACSGQYLPSSFTESRTLLKPGIYPDSALSSPRMDINDPPIEVRPTTKSTLSPSLPSIEFINREIGLDAVKIWAQRAEESSNPMEFHRWLDSVKDLLGSKAYSLWLEDIRPLAAHSKALHDWFSSSNAQGYSNDHLRAIQTNRQSQTRSGDGKADGNEPKRGIFNTQSLMNPTYHGQGYNFSLTNFPRVIPYLFSPGSRSSPRHVGYYILPSVDDVANSRHRGPLRQSNQKGVLRAFSNDSETLETKKNVSLVNLLQILLQERRLYQEVINKTLEIVSRVKPFLPPTEFDELLEKFQDNFTDFSNLTSGILEQRKLADINLMISNKTTTTEGDDESESEDTEFVLVEYDDSTGIDLNQTVPRIVIRVENSLQPPMRIGEIQVKTTPEVSGKFLNVSTDTSPDEYYQEDLYYSLTVPQSNTTVSATKFEP